MKFRMFKMVVMFVSLIFVGLMLTGQSIAKIDPKTVTGLWMFDEGSGNSAKDSSGAGLNGKFTGTPKWVDGKFGKGLEFDGKSYVTIPDHKNPTKAITISIWAKSPTATWNEHGWLVEKRDAYILHPVGGTVNLAFCVVNGAPWNTPKSWDTGAIGPKDITQWHLYTCTFDSATGKWNIYIDGVVASSLDLDKKELAADPGPVNIGFDDCCGGTRFGKGTVDEVAIFNVALPADDVKSLMNGLGSSLTAVGSAGKLSVTWADIKTKE